MLGIVAVATLDQAVAQDDGAGTPFASRNVGSVRAGATDAPRTEGDQALVNGWPMYRTERGQIAFNDVMATMKATSAQVTAPAAFEHCPNLECTLQLPAIGSDGWVPAGRLWVSPKDYVLIAHSPRSRGVSRRASRDMRYFVYHEFHNSTRNADVYDTISAHGGSVFVPFYLSKEGTDARGQRFVVIVQVAPYDVESVHATNWGSNGPGVEVAKNFTDPLEPLQALAGVLLGTIVKAAAPHLRVVNHRGSEGLPMLRAYESRLAAIRGRPEARAIALPLVPARPQHVAIASGRPEDLITRNGLSPRLPVVERGIVPPRAALQASSEAELPPPMLLGAIRLVKRKPTAPEPVLVGPIMPAVRPAKARGG